MKHLVFTVLCLATVLMSCVVESDELSDLSNQSSSGENLIALSSSAETKEDSSALDSLPFNCLAAVSVCVRKTIEKEIQCITTPCDPVTESIYYVEELGCGMPELENNNLDIVDGSFCETLPPKDTIRFCTEEYMPVCGVDSLKNFKTFSNKCTAEVAGYEFSYKGECGVTKPDSTCETRIDACLKIVVEKEIQCITTPCDPIAETIYRTERIGCEMLQNENVTVVDESYCKAPPVNDSLVVCTMEYMPVCGVDSLKNFKTFSNKCTAVSAGYRVAHDGECDRSQ